VAPNEEIAMSPTTVPSRITIDFRDAALPSRTWILGVDEAATDRLELIAFEGGRPANEPAPRPRQLSYSAAAECACPEFCERDHANE
jgi:hypothetical protein